MLTGKKKKFVTYLKKGLTQKEAAIKAGYSQKTAKIKGSQLAKDKDVRSYIEKINSINDSVTIEAEEQQQIETTQPVKTSIQYDDPVEVMKKIMSENIIHDPKLSLEAAAKLAPYVCKKIADSGKKVAKNEAAKKAISKFGSMPPPKLVVHNKG